METTQLRLPALAMLLLLLPAAAPPRERQPQRILSINMCSDLLLLMLVPRERIASISWPGRDAARSLLPGRADGIPTNHGAAEEILAARPDLILASPWTSAVARQLAQRTGARVELVEDANDFPQIRARLRQLGKAVGEPARAEALVRGMDAELARLATTAPRRPLRVVAWSGGRAAPGRGTLTDAIIRAAGAENIAARFDDGRYADFGLEELLEARPDAILQGIAGHEPPSLRKTAIDHPVLRRHFAGRQIAYPEAAYACGLPQSARAATELRQALSGLPAESPQW